MALAATILCVAAPAQNDNVRRAKGHPECRIRTDRQIPDDCFDKSVRSNGLGCPVILPWAPTGPAGRKSAEQSPVSAGRPAIPARLFSTIFRPWILARSDRSMCR
jgi:hypothetical protein